MKITYSLDDFETIYAERIIPDNHQIDQKHVIEQQIVLKSKSYDEHVKAFFLNGASMGFVNRYFSDSVSYQMRSDAEYLQMHFELKGAALYVPKESIEKELEITTGTHSLFYYPYLNGTLSSPCCKGGFNVQIEISLNYLYEVFNQDLSFLGDFYDDIKNQRSSILGGKSFPITAKMKTVLLDMYYCPYIDHLKTIYIEAKLRELLTLQINQLLQKETTNKAYLGKIDLEKVVAVKEIIAANLKNPYSIEELATMVGTNRTKLQNDFKKAYTNTIYGTIAELRMKKAKELLESNESIKIAEIAKSVGYKNANHFSTAFKKMFGMLPKHLKI